jgi:dihydropteroate synthase
MGVVNVTDDSFSDGGRYLDADRAVEQGLALVADGATIIDVGGESTRPGAQRIDPRVETARVVPVVKELAAKGITVSIDTMHAGVARAALENGASMVNDVSGGRADEDMAALLVDADVPWVPVLGGASRKRFLGSLLAGPDGEVRPPDGRETATAVVSALAALHGAWGVRVHDVRASVDAVKVVEAWTRGGVDG